MDKNICDSIKTLSILKFIIKSINPDILNIKLIFVGPQTDKTKDILQKIEKKKIKEDVSKDKSIEDKSKDLNTYMHSILSASENKYLEKIIPYYITKFGNISHYNVFFIYKFIEENLPIEHVRIILYETIKKYILPKTKQNENVYLPTHMLLYKYPKTMSFKYFIEQINYII